MIHLYRIILPILGMLSLPYYAFRMIRRGGYSFKFSFRFGLWPKLPPPMKGKTRIWIQAVSVGELSSISKLLNFLLDESDVELVLSGTTSTGLSLGEKHYGSDVLANGPFPLDWLPFSRTAWREESNLIFLSLWTANSGPNCFHQAKKKENSSDNCECPSIGSYFLQTSLTKTSLGSPFALSLKPNGCRLFGKTGRSRWLGLNFPQKNLHTSGNLKIDAVERKKLQT